MNFNEYQQQAHTFAAYQDNMYPVLGLAEETGEVLGLIAKWKRGDDVAKRFGSFAGWHEAVKKELGDVLWMLAEVADQMDLTLEDVAVSNITKLTDRKARNVIKGSGDDR